MKPFRSKRRLLVAVGLIVPAVLALGTVLAWFGPRYFRDARVREEMRKECHPVWRDLEEGRVRAGQPVDEVIATTLPSRVVRFGDYTKLTYYKGSTGGIHFTALTVVAKDGKLVWAVAGSCCWERIFFNEMSQETHADCEQAYRAYVALKRREQGGEKPR